MKKKIIIFTLILICIFSLSNLLFRGKIDRKTFNVLNYSKEKYDVLFVGSSHSYMSFNTRIIDNKLHVNSYNLGSGSQPIEMSYYALKEFNEKSYKPQIVIFELLSLINDKEKFKNTEASDSIINSLPIGNNKKNTLEIYPPKEKIDYLFPVIKYHAMWKTPVDLIKNTLRQFKPLYKGFDNSWESIYTPKIDILNKNQELKEITEYNLKYLDLIINETKKNNQKLILVIAPVRSDYSNYQKIKSIKRELLKKRENLTILDLSNMNELDFKDNEFRDSNHLNGKGAIKTSEYISDYIISNQLLTEKNYNIKDQEGIDEYYIYNSKKIDKDINIIKPKSIKNVFIIDKEKNISEISDIMSYITTKILNFSDIKTFLKSKERFNLYLEINEELKIKNVELFLKDKNNNIIKTIKLSNIEIDLNGKKEKKVIPGLDIRILNNKRYIIIKNIFLLKQLKEIKIKL